MCGWFQEGINLIFKVFITECNFGINQKKWAFDSIKTETIILSNAYSHHCARFYSTLKKLSLPKNYYNRKAFHINFGVVYTCDDDDNTSTNTYDFMPLNRKKECTQEENAFAITLKIYLFFFVKSIAKKFL